MNDQPVPAPRSLCVEGHVPTLRRTHGIGPDLACQLCLDASRAAVAGWGGYGTIPTPAGSVAELSREAGIVTEELLRGLGAVAARDPAVAAEFARDFGVVLARQFRAAECPEVAVPLDKLAGLFRRAAVRVAKAIPLPPRNGS